ncbi:MAG: hypothetical protein ACXVW6_02640 [Nocardioidaceae bacterium]
MRTARRAVPVVAALAVLGLVVVLFGLRGGTDTGDAASPPLRPAPVSPGAPGSTPPDPLRVPVAGYTSHGTTLTLHYALGIARCYGALAPPRVVETARAVTVTLRRIPPKQRTPQVCPFFALVRSVDVTLSGPLGSRPVLDGGNGGSPVPRGDPSGATPGR